MNLIGLVGIVIEIFTQSLRQVPDAYHEQRDQHCFARDTEKLPQRRFKQRYKEGRQKKRNRRKDRTLALPVFAPIVFENLVNDPVPTSLDGYRSRTLRMRIVR